MPLLRLPRAEPVLFAIWAIELAGLVWSPPEMRTASGILMIAYLTLSLPRLRRGTIVLCLPLAVGAAALATWYGQWGAIFRGFAGGAVFVAFFGSIVLLRAIADRRPEIARARTLFTGLRREETNGAFLVGAHLIGAVLVVGVMALLAPILGRDADDATRRRAAEVSQRGMCLAPLWSPFWVAAAFAAQQIHGVPAWQIMGVGAALAAVGLVVAHVMYARGVGLGDLWRAIRGFAPIVPIVLLCAAAIAVLSSVAGLSTLKALIATIPALAVLVCVFEGRRYARVLAAETWRGGGRIADEVSVVTVAMVLGRVLEHAIHEAGLGSAIGALGLPPWAVIAAVVATITIAALVGIHQIVSLLVVFVVFAPLDTGVADVILMEAGLVGWGFASMVGVTAVSTATASAMFRVPRGQLIFGPNLAFVAVFGALSVVLLSVANGLFFAR